MQNSGIELNKLDRPIDSIGSPVHQMDRATKRPIFDALTTLIFQFHNHNHNYLPCLLCLWMSDQHGRDNLCSWTRSWPEFDHLCSLCVSLKWMGKSDGVFLMKVCKRINTTPYVKYAILVRQHILNAWKVLPKSAYICDKNCLATNQQNQYVYLVFGRVHLPVVMVYFVSLAVSIKRLLRIYIFTLGMNTVQKVKAVHFSVSVGSSYRRKK